MFGCFIIVKCHHSKEFIEGGNQVNEIIDVKGCQHGFFIGAQAQLCFRSKCFIRIFGRITIMRSCYQVEQKQAKARMFT